MRIQTFMHAGSVPSNAHARLETRPILIFYFLFHFRQGTLAFPDRRSSKMNNSSEVYYDCPGATEEELATYEEIAGMMEKQGQVITERLVVIGRSSWICNRSANHNNYITYL